MTRLRNRWNELPRSRQLGLAGIAVATLVILYMVFKSSSQPNLVTAFSGLAPEDTSAIADQLEKDGTPYEIGAGGTSVAVPANKVAEVRIKLASAGLLQGTGTGLEIFDKTHFGATDFVNQINYVRGLEGELARSINTIEGMRGSRVHIVIPKDALFKDDQDDATASVILQMKPGARLSQDQIRGIANLVSHSVEGLDMSGVTVIDDTGKVLFDGATFDGPFAIGGTATQLEMQRLYETALQRDLEGTLAKVVGAGRSAVTVRARMNFDTVQSNVDTYAPAAQAVPRSTTQTTETFTGNNLNVGGIPGTGANAGDTGTGTANGATNYTRTETTTNNEISKTTTSTIRAPGAVERLSVSVVLDESVTAAQESAITSAVAAAVGLDQTRGDTLSVTRLPFDASAVEEFVTATSSGLGQYTGYLKTLLPLLAVVLAFVLVMMLLRSLAKRQQLAALPAPAAVQALGPGMAPLGLQQPSIHLPDIDIPHDPREERLLRTAETNPRAVADVIQTWVREDV
jgi:flagellar M-ring protein FliF